MHANRVFVEFNWIIAGYYSPKGITFISLIALLPSILPFLKIFQGINILNQTLVSTNHCSIFKTSDLFQLALLKVFKTSFIARCCSLLSVAYICE
jgi:hypothetical protein